MARLNGHEIRRLFAYHQARLRAQQQQQQGV